jgi:hypothetical protein
MKLLDDPRLDAMAAEWLRKHRHGVDTSEAYDELRALLQDVWALASGWEDVTDEWTEQIREAFPTRSGSHEHYAEAMRMVGHRHSKGELAALVNWLLVRCDNRPHLGREPQ